MQYTVWYISVKTFSYQLIWVESLVYTSVLFQDCSYTSGYCEWLTQFNSWSRITTITIGVISILLTKLRCIALHFNNLLLREKKFQVNIAIYCWHNCLITWILCFNQLCIQHCKLIMFWPPPVGGGGVTQKMVHNHQSDDRWYMIKRSWGTKSVNPHKLEVNVSLNDRILSLWYWYAPYGLVICPWWKARNVKLS